MRKPPPLRAGDLRGVARLAVEATAGVTDLVEAVHARVAHAARLGGLSGRPAAGERTRGISGLVYRSVRGVTRLAGGGVDTLLGLLPAADGDDTRHPGREAVLAALNGVLGDHLAASGNPLALPMRWRSGGRTLTLTRSALAAQLPAGNRATGRIVLLLHGLCMNDLQWQRAGHDHGAMLARERGYTPVYLHYNSGLPIAANGLALAQQIEALLDAWPAPVERLAVVAHSMGGLLARSALHQARAAGLRWPQRLDDLVFLGTPHHGAPLERAGHGVDRLLAALPYTAPFARLGRLRSAGITDLRHGRVLDDGQDARGRPPPLALPEGPRCHAVAATTGARRGDLKDRLLGDGLVPLDSALGRHRDPARRLVFDDQRKLVVHGIGHLALLQDAQVADALRRWLA